MKLKIRKYYGLWEVILPNGFKHGFLFPDAAFAAASKYLNDTNRLEKALHKIFWINMSLVTDKEADVIFSVKSNMKCSKKQYGWISGILERQQTPKRP